MTNWKSMSKNERREEVQNEMWNVGPEDTRRSRGNSVWVNVRSRTMGPVVEETWVNSGTGSMRVVRDNGVDEPNRPGKPMNEE